ncbi:MAG: citrate/2-methylcitrate synthase [Clostridiales bacterium]|nr:citrate/2-methylcitrate synthase [Clostridiales bacterium]
MISEETRERLKTLSRLAGESTVIDNAFYQKYDVKRGLRDISGKGVVCGLTEISEVVSSKQNERGESVAAEGELYYRGIEIRDLIGGVTSEARFGFEEAAYLLLFGRLPNRRELAEFEGILAEMRTLPKNFVRDIIMKAPSFDMMNSLSMSVLAMYYYDENPDDIGLDNVLRQVLQLIACFPLLAVYGYQTAQYYHEEDSLIIHRAQPNLSTAENILYLLRHNKEYSELEALILDLCLILHAEHGGGNNSTFTTHVVTSSGTDTYAVMAASLGSLKGPRHGGANIKVVKMFEDLKANVKDRSDAAIEDYLARLLDKKAFDNAGLIYGMGHAVYSLSDPRAEIFKWYVEKLAIEKRREDEYALYKKVASLAPGIIGDKRKIYKGVSANVDFYSGFVYSMLGLPMELYTPLFAVARMAGWGAHRIEELANNGKIIRPGYTAVSERKKYVPLSERK